MSTITASDIRDLESEAGVIASVIIHPEFVFYSEQLAPNHFTNKQNAYLYYAIRKLAQKNIGAIDAYNITNILNANPTTREIADSILPAQAIQEFIENASVIARNSFE